MSSYLRIHNNRNARVIRRISKNIRKSNLNNIKKSLKDSTQTNKYNHQSIHYIPNNVIKKHEIPESEIVSIIRKTLLEMNTLNYDYLKCNLNNRKIIQNFTNTHNHSSQVSLLEGYIVMKKFKKKQIDHKMFYNELKALNMIYSHQHFPQLIFFDPQSLIIYMTYCGKEISAQNLPENWKAQYQEIGNILQHVKLNPNDIITRNLCVLDNVIHIIDFGLANVSNIASSLKKLYIILSQMNRID